MQATPLSAALTSAHHGKPAGAPPGVRQSAEQADTLASFADLLLSAADDPGATKDPGEIASSAAFGMDLDASALNFPQIRTDEVRAGQRDPDEQQMQTDPSAQDMSAWLADWMQQPSFKPSVDSETVPHDPSKLAAEAVDAAVRASSAEILSPATSPDTATVAAAQALSLSKADSLNATTAGKNGLTDLAESASSPLPQPEPDASRMPVDVGTTAQLQVVSNGSAAPAVASLVGTHQETTEARTARLTPPSATQRKRLAEPVKLADAPAERVRAPAGQVQETVAPPARITSPDPSTAAPHKVSTQDASSSARPTPAAAKLSPSEGSGSITAGIPPAVTATFVTDARSTLSATPTARLESQVPDEVYSPGFAPTFGARIATLARDGIEHARVHLNPVEMGPVSVDLSLEGTQVRVDMTASQATTRLALEQALPSLAGALREAGFTLNGGGIHQPAPEARVTAVPDTNAQANTQSQAQGGTAGGAWDQSHGSAARQGGPSDQMPQQRREQEGSSRVVSVGPEIAEQAARAIAGRSGRAGSRLVDVFA